MREADDTQLRSDQQRLLKAMLRVGRWKGTALAAAAQIAQTTVNRPLQPELPKTALTSTTLRKLFQTMEARVRDLDREDGYEPGSGPHSQSWHNVLNWYQANALGLPMTEVIGAVQAGFWLEALEWHVEERYAVPMPADPRYPRARRFGLEVRGNSMDLVWKAGTVVICVPIDEVGHDLADGNYVVMQRRGPDDMIEATLKQLRIDDDGKAWLVPRSTDPRHQTPIPLEGNDGEEISVIALVVGQYGQVATGGGKTLPLTAVRSEAAAD